MSFISTRTYESLQQVLERENSHVYFGNRKANLHTSQTVVPTIFHLNFTGSSCKYMDIYDSLASTDTIIAATTANNFVATMRQENYIWDDMLPL